MIVVVVGFFGVFFFFLSFIRHVLNMTAIFESVRGHKKTLFDVLLMIKLILKHNMNYLYYAENQVHAIFQKR